MIVSELTFGLITRVSNVCHMLVIAEGSFHKVYVSREVEEGAKLFLRPSAFEDFKPRLHLFNPVFLHLSPTPNISTHATMA